MSPCSSGAAEGEHGETLATSLSIFYCVGFEVWQDP